ncbi:hypothetical protein ACQP1V_23530 [Microtetraspora malaysiensis]|uniref:hypothetical protein n=1 Tax=Microtetraspora malaysiensis TaxID=161358 RepID=UPI003D8B7E39
MSTPSRATVITASVAIGVFGAGTAVGTVIATNSHPTDLSAARLTAGTYQLDDGVDAWTTLAATGTGLATSLTGTDAGSTITADSGKQRVCLGTTTDGHAVDAAAQGCASLPVLAASQFAALRQPGNTKATGVPEPKNTPKSEPKNTPKDTKNTPKAGAGGAGATPQPTAKAAGKPPAVVAPIKAPEPTKAPAATVPPATTETIGATASPAPVQSFVTVTATPGVTTSTTPAVTPSPAKGAVAAASPSAIPSPAAGQWGKVVGTTQDGAKLMERSDGSRAIFGPDNKLIRVMPGPWATDVKVLPDGNWLMLRPNGDRMIVSPAGLELAPQQNTAPPTPPAGGTGTGTGAGARTGTGAGTGTGTGSGAGAGGGTGTGAGAGTGTGAGAGTGAAGGTATGGTTTTGSTGTTGTGAGSDITTGTGTGSTGDGAGHGTRHRSGHGDGERSRYRSERGGSAGRSAEGSGTEGVSGTAGRPDGGAADGTVTGTGADAGAGASAGVGTGAGSGDGAGSGGGNAYAPGMEDALPVLQDPELLQRASQALGLDEGMSYTDENGVWDLNIAPPGTPPCHDYSRSELSRRGIPRDSCALPAFVRWLYADPTPGEVSNWTKFTGLPERNLELVVTNPSAQPTSAGAPGQVEPDASGYAG